MKIKINLFFIEAIRYLRDLTRDNDGHLTAHPAPSSMRASTKSVLSPEISFRSPLCGKVSLFSLQDCIRLGKLKRGNAIAEPCCQYLCRQFSPFEFPQRTLPDRCHAPPRGEKRCANSVVPRDIRLEFRVPKLWARRWRGRVAAFRMAMPEAAMDEHRRFPARKDEIRAPGKSTATQDVTQTQGVQALPQDNFRFGGTAGYGPHDPGSGLCIDNVCHGSARCPCERPSAAKARRTIS